MELPQRTLLESNEPWTRYRVMVDLIGLEQNTEPVQKAKADLVIHPQVQSLIKDVQSWPAGALQRHNDANHALHKFAVLADFGLDKNDPGIATAIEALLAHQSSEGAFQSLLNISKTFGGSGENTWTWILCDAPVLLHALLCLGYGQDPRVIKAAQHLVDLVNENGWQCKAGVEVGRFRGPGRKGDPCPIATVYALQALALLPEFMACPAALAGVEMLLTHWEKRKEVKYYLFGMGTDFQKIKYPFIWYDILHVCTVLNHFPAARADSRYQTMLEILRTNLDSQGMVRASSAYQAWKGWSFADKKTPSPWLTYLVWRLL